MGIDSMDEVRCPMCSKKNPADAESCEFCGARIKPLIIQQPPEETPSGEERILPSGPDQPEEQPFEEEQSSKQPAQETDWLTRMRYGVKDEGEVVEFDLPDEDEGPKRGETDLLGRFRDLGISGDEEESVKEAESLQAEIEPPTSLEPELPQEEESLQAEIEPPTLLEPELPQEEESILEWDRILPESEKAREVETPLPEEEIFELPSQDIEAEGDQEEAPVPDWLARIRAREEAEEVEPPKGLGETDWLSGLRDVSFTPGDEEEEISDSLEDLLISEPAPDLEKTLEPFTSESPEEEELVSGDVEHDISSAQASIDDLFSDMSLFEDEVEEVSTDELPIDLAPPSSAEEDLSDLDDLFGDLESPPVEEGKGLLDENLFEQIGTVPTEEIDELFDDDLFSDIEGEIDQEKEISDSDLFAERVEEPIEEGEPLLDANFFADLGIEIGEDVEGAHEDQPVSDIAKPQEITPPEEAAFEKDLQEEPSGIQELAPGSDLLAREPFIDEFVSEEIVPSLEESFDEVSQERSSLSDLLGDFSPSWLDDTISEAGGELPHVPALILDDELPPLDVGIDETDLASAEIPDWLQDLGKDVEEELIDEEDEVPTLAKATLPPWLEAMRPIETFRAAPEIELELEEEEEIIEAAGPLAGLKGVLLAEPVVAMPRSPIIALGALDISDRDLSQAEILQEMVEEEEREEAEYEVKRAQVPILRWVCAALLVLAILIPSVLGGPAFGSPTRAPRDFSPLLELVQSIPVGKPVLLVFDYDPSYSPEMDAIAGALIENLFAQDQTMVTLSTKPSGPMLADRMLRRVGQVHQAVNGVDYIHLGYLSGGPTALQLLSSSPPEALAQGFNLPEEFEGETVWDSPLLTNIKQLSDFSMVAIITSGTESARNWVEQAHPQLGDIPLVMVLNAGSEPIIRPYFEAESPQVDGILSGLPSAMIYEERVNGLLADAAQRWNGYGMGLLVAVLILLSGAGNGVVSWIIQRFRIRQG
jgi:hypothetical protein